MKKCKRNIFLIFGYLLIVIVLFIPCEQGIYSLSEVDGYPEDVPELESGLPEGAPPPPLPDLIPVRVLDYRKMTKRTFHKIEIKPLPLYIVNLVNYQNFKKWKREKEKVWNSIISKDKITIEELFYLQNEFIDEHDGEFRFFSINADIYVLEIMLTLLVAGFAYIIFCQVLRKREEER